MTLPLSAMPNAGLPRDSGRPQDVHGLAGVHGELRPPHRRGRRRIVGGLLRHHAGTHQGHGGLRPERGAAARPRDRRATPPRRACRPCRSPSARACGAKLAAGEFVTTVEIVPPQGVDPRRCSREVRVLKAAGVDRRRCAEWPQAQSRMGALLSASSSGKSGSRPWSTDACRDRNLPRRCSISSRHGGRASQPVHRHRRPAEDGPYPTPPPFSTIDAIGLTNVVVRLITASTPADADRRADQVRHRRRRQSDSPGIRTGRWRDSRGRSTPAPSTR